MSEVGKWMNTHAEAIRGPTASPLSKPDYDGHLTSKGEVTYLHLFSRPESGTVSLKLSATKATMLDGGAVVKFAVKDDIITLQLPPSLPDPVATVIRLE